MKELWAKNKFTLISLMIYLVTTLSVGDLTGHRLLVFILSALSLPLVYNMKISSNCKSWWVFIIAGFIFGFYITPFEISSHSVSIYNKISYWVLLISLNVFFHLHRYSVSDFRNNERLAGKRDTLIDEILHPIKKRFFQ